MQFFLEFLTKGLIYISLSAIILPILMLSFIDEDALKPNAPTLVLGSMIGGIIVFFITAALSTTGILPYIFV